MSSVAGHGYAVWALIAAVFTLAGLVKGVVGLGLPTLSMALLALWMAPAEAAALLIVPSLVTNLWQLRPLAGLAALARRLMGMQAGIVIGTLAGAWCFGAVTSTGATLVLGLALVGYAGWGLWGKPLHVPARHERWLGPVTGLLTGAVTALTGVFVLPAVMYLQSLKLSREELIQALGLSFTTSTIALAAALAMAWSASDGQPWNSAPLLAASVLMLVPALAGMAIGQWVRLRMAIPLFRRVFFSGLGLLGFYVVIRALIN